MNHTDAYRGQRFDGPAQFALGGAPVGIVE